VLGWVVKYDGVVGGALEQSPGLGQVLNHFGSIHFIFEVLEFFEIKAFLLLI